MTVRPIVLLVSTSDARRRALSDALDGVEVRQAGYDSEITDRPVTACVELGTDPQPGLAFITKLHAAMPDVGIVAIADAKDPDLILRAMRSGAREFILASDDKAQLIALREFIGKRTRAGTVLTSYTARGGVGCTTLAVNMAPALAQNGRRVAVVDLDLQFGNIPLFLDVEPKFTVSDLLGNMDRLDGELLLTSMVRHKSGVWVLAQGNRIEEAEHVTNADITRAISFLKRHFDYLILDGVRGFNERTLQLLDMSDFLMIVLTQDMPSVKNGQFCVSLLRRLGYDERKIKIVVNRALRKGAAIDLDVVVDFIRLPIAAEVANDYPTVAKAITEGKLLSEQAPRARVTRDIEVLAGLFEADLLQPERSRGLLGRLFGRKPTVGLQVNHGTERPA